MAAGPSGGGPGVAARLTAEAAPAGVTGIEWRLRAIPRPTPVLARERERALTARQRELLDQLGGVFDGGFADLTMAGLAARLNCSLRTLYELAPSRDELVLVVVDRNLWRIGRTAANAIAPDMAPLDALRAYLRAATEAVSGTTQAFARDLAAVPAAQPAEFFLVASDVGGDGLQGLAELGDLGGQAGQRVGVAGVGAVFLNDGA